MKVIQDIKLCDFLAWSGGRDTIKELTFGDMLKVQDFIEQTYEMPIDEIELNDFLWFERDIIAEICGFKDFDEMIEKRRNKNANLHRNRK